MLILGFVVIVVIVVILLLMFGRQGKTSRRAVQAAREQSQMIYDAMRPEAKARVAAERAKRSFFYIPIPKDAEPVQPRAAWREGNWARLKAKKDR